MKEDNLETLKDINLLVVHKDAQVPQIIEAYDKQLRDEAVKWVKTPKSYHGGGMYLFPQLNDKDMDLEDVLKYIFNLTEEDLK